jgi:hypothetical protein
VRGRGYEGKAGLIKHDVSGDHNTISGKMNVAIPSMIRGIADENTPGWMRRKLMWGCRRQVGVVGTPKDPKMLVGRRCVVEGGVKIGGNAGFCWKMIQQISSDVEALYPILWWHGSLKQHSVNNIVGGAQHTLGFTILRRAIWAGHPEVHAMSKEELPRGGVEELTPIVTFDALNIVTELSADKRK